MNRPKPKIAKAIKAPRMKNVKNGCRATIFCDRHAGSAIWSWYAGPRQEYSPSDPSLRPQIAVIFEVSIRYRLDKEPPIVTHLRTPFQSRTSSLRDQEMLVHPLQSGKDASPIELERVPLQGRVVVLVELS
jgi:hypothetical protein